MPGSSSTISTMTPTDVIFPGAKAGASFKNPFHHQSLRVAPKKLIKKYPLLSVAELMQAPVPAIKYSELKLGSAGSCLQMHVFGGCTVPGCTFRHSGFVAKLTDKQASSAATVLARGITAYLESHGG